MITKTPLELTLLVFARLDLREVLRCRQVCRLLRDIIDGDATIQYRVNLTLSCMEDNTLNQLGIVKKKNLLTLYQIAWWNLSPTAFFPTYDAATIECVQRRGTYMTMAPGGMNDARVRQLPSRIRRIAEGLRYLGSLSDGSDRDMVRVDPVEGLIFVVGKRWERQEQGSTEQYVTIHLVSMSDGGPHPAAVSPTFPVVVDGNIAHQYLDICGDYFTFVETYYDDSPNVPMELRVINWKTGKIHLWLRGCGIGSCNFISDTYILITLLGMEYVQWRSSPCLAIVKIDPQQIVTEAIDPTASSFVCILRYADFPLQSLDINVLTAGSYAWHEPENPDVPFYHAKEHALVDIELQVSRDLTLVHLIPLFTLFRIIRETTGATRVLQWQD
ncbi:hypothetical protein CERSUDRAFT_67329 [Gelatoporia subvermispora B]|uniref:F-box domain-containing protein n=1 Tax=Ceriporiopsis subvermispora (strain B) TaxID=914234 RepID=M2R7A9_CERS8|nr:hypothetical protein CERSUDRAFT_67329 [Gelatoporia subvermispora B]